MAPTARACLASQNGFVIHNQSSAPLDLSLVRSKPDVIASTSLASCGLTCSARSTSFLSLDRSEAGGTSKSSWRRKGGPSLRLQVRKAAGADEKDVGDLSGGAGPTPGSGEFVVESWALREGRTKVRRLACVDAAAVRIGHRKTGSAWLVYQWRDVGGSIHLSFFDAPPPLTSWMSALSSTTPLASIYLPGTHESLALHGFPISSCQTFPLAMQLDAGIRFLDLRFALKKGVLVAYHGIQNQFVTAEVAFRGLYDWLDGPGRGETVVISVKQENKGAGAFEDAMVALIDQRPEMWYYENRWPLLGEVRHKLVLFCRYRYHQMRGIHPEVWLNNASEPWASTIGSQEVIVQDWYSIGSFVRIPEKAALVLSLFNRRTNVAVAASDPARLRINFCSGATLLTAFPFVVAKGLGIGFLGLKGVNERVFEHLVQSGREEPGDRGMCLLLDYWEVPTGLVELFVAWNF